MDGTGTENQRPLEVRPNASFVGSNAGVGGWLIQVILVVAVVVFGAANNITKQIASKPLKRYTYMIGLATAVSYVPLYGGVLLSLLRAGIVPGYQMQFVWGPNSNSYRFVWLFAASALGDTLGDVIGAICTPYVSGPIHSLLSNCTTIFVAMLSMCVLSKRYSLLQCLALCTVISAVVIGTLPSFSKEASKKNETNPFFAIVLGASCIFNAISFVIKELLFSRYNSWVESRQLQNDKGLHVFIVNTHAALFQLPFTLLCVPFNQALGQTHGEDVFTYLGDAFTCLFSTSPDSCGPESIHAEASGICVAVYVVANVCWNLAILASVKYNGALTTFVALKAVFPLSSFLFAYVHWPLLGITPLKWLTWLSICVMLPSIGAFQWASVQQQKRAKQDMSSASCCWPLCLIRPVAARQPLI